MIGEFEYLILTAAANLGEEAYGTAILEEIRKTTGQRRSIGALYTTMKRLEAKGLLKTWMGGATQERGGRAKRLVSVTPTGTRAARDFYQAMMRISRGAAWAVLDPEAAK
jgi:DNA-binding PadR family transcriptional regulator